MSHLDPPKLDSPDAKKVLEHIQRVRGAPFSEIWQTMLHHPALTQAVSDVGQILRFEGVLPGNIRESAILYISSSTRASYEWAAHIQMAKKEKVPEEILSFIKQKRYFADFPEPYSDVMEAAQMSLEKRSLPSSLQERLIEQYGKKGLVELILLTGYYQMLAAFLNGFDVIVE